MSGRRLFGCRTLLKCVILNGNHWMAAARTRQQPNVIYTIDSMARSSSHRRALSPFVSLCVTLSGTDARIAIQAVPVAQQTDGCSCGLFVIEYCKVLCTQGADVSSEATQALCGRWRRETRGSG